MSHGKCITSVVLIQEKSQYQYGQKLKVLAVVSGIKNMAGEVWCRPLVVPKNRLLCGNGGRPGQARNVI